MVTFLEVLAGRGSVSRKFSSMAQTAHSDLKENRLTALQNGTIVSLTHLYLYASHFRSLEHANSEQEKKPFAIIKLHLNSLLNSVKRNIDNISRARCSLRRMCNC